MDQTQQVIEHPHQAIITLQGIDNGMIPGEPRYGGLRCHWCIPFRPGSGLFVRIITANNHTDVLAVVTDCKLDDDGYQIEMGFCDPQTAFEVRMIEQLCHIQAYQQQIQRLEGRKLSANQAAREWIDRFAEDFPAA